LWVSAIHLQFQFFAYFISKPENIVPQIKLCNLFAFYGCWPPDCPDIGFSCPQAGLSVEVRLPRTRQGASFLPKIIPQKK
jgi:hypothetical protein